MDQEPANPEPNTSEAQPADRLPVINYLTPGPPVRPVRLRGFPSSGEAAMARSLLESHGIRSEVSGRLSLRDAGPYGGAGGLDILVDEDQLEEARKILQTIEDRRQARLAAARARLNCPRCGSNISIAFDRRFFKAAIALYFAAGASLVVLWIPGLSEQVHDTARFAMIGAVAVGVMLHMVAVGKHTCPQCGNIWATPEKEDNSEEDDEDDAANSDGESSEIS